MHENIYTEFNERLLWMNCVVKVKERGEVKSSLESMNVSICTRWVRLVASRRLTRISCRRQQSAATNKQRDEIKEENVIRCDFLLLKPQSVYEDLAFVGRVAWKPKTDDFIHIACLREWVRRKWEFVIQIYLRRHFVVFGHEGILTLCTGNCLKDDLKPLEMKSPTQIVTNFNLMTMTTMRCYQYISSRSSSWSLIGCKWDDRFRIN